MFDGEGLMARRLSFIRWREGKSFTCALLGVLLVSGPTCSARIAVSEPSLLAQAPVTDVTVDSAQSKTDSVPAADSLPTAGTMPAADSLPATGSTPGDDSLPAAGS